MDNMASQWPLTTEAPMAANVCEHSMSHLVGVVAVVRESIVWACGMLDDHDLYVELWCFCGDALATGGQGMDDRGRRHARQEWTSKQGLRPAGIKGCCGNMTAAQHLNAGQLQLSWQSADHQIIDKASCLSKLVVELFDLIMSLDVLVHIRF